MMQIVRTLEELDEKIGECDRAATDDELRAILANFRMEPPLDLPEDPFSAKYYKFQMALYRHLAGKDYTPANAVTNVDWAAMLNRPYPYFTDSCATAGEHLMAIGFLLRTMALPPRSRVLEFGPRWGNTTITMAKLGHAVTAVDIEPRFCELIRQRAAREEVAIEVVNADFMWVRGVREAFDAVVFFESFQHAVDHLRLLWSLREAVSPEGRIFFAAEPIHPDFPYSWGVRLDGGSLWSIRRNGWLELGFNEAYFTRALALTGWFGRKHVAADLGPMLNVWEVRRRDRTVLRFTADRSELMTQVGARSGNAIELTDASAGLAVFGPYINLPAGRYVSRLCFGAREKPHGRGHMEVSVRRGDKVLATRSIDMALLPEENPWVEVEAGSAQELLDMEVRLFCSAGFTATIEAVEIRPVG